MTRYRLLGLMGVIGVAALTIGAADSPRKSVFSELKVGQPVGLKDRGTAYEISVFEDNLPQSHNVVEIGENFIVLQDVAKVTKTTIPVYAIKSIVRLKVP